MQPFEDFYIEAFWKLNTERFYEGGPIPFSAISVFITSNQVDKDLISLFIKVIRSLDESYQKWLAKNRGK